MQLALREIRRAKLRFALLTGAVALLVFLVLFQQSLLGGLVTSFVGAIRNQDAPVLVFGDQARRTVEASFLPPEAVEAVAGVDGVARSAPLGQGTFTVKAGGETVDASVFGHVPGGPGQPATLSEGRRPERPFEAVASAGDADEGFGIGDRVRIVGRPDVVVTVVGLAEDLQYSVAPTLFTWYETWAAAVRAVRPDTPAPLASLVAVEPAGGVAPQELAAAITAEVDGVEALTRDRAADESPGVQAVRQSFSIILVLALLVVALVVGFFFVILTVQKARALTLLRAVGAPDSYLVRNLLAQVATVLLGGVMLGALLVVLVRAVTPTGGVPVELDPRTALPTLGLLCGLGLLGGLVAARRVLRLDPLSATSGGGAP
jgi:putative ABC transport system permease protein